MLIYSSKKSNACQMSLFAVLLGLIFIARQGGGATGSTSSPFYVVDALVLPQGKRAGRLSPTRKGYTSGRLLGKNKKAFSPSSSALSSSVTSSSSSSSSSSFSKWANFDYEQHWYPVSWICDLRSNEPTKVTLFDVDYVVAVDKTCFDESDKKKEKPLRITALRDACPHRSAALSEGRITSSGAIQCAYHGWSFNGTTGDCIQIPQASQTATSFSSRTCAQAIPAMAHQGMLWLWPGPPKASEADYPLPPTIPEMDQYPDFKTVRVVRDFPDVDWTLLVSNILDPDHGLFAHQRPPFDWYSASPELPLTLQESFDNGDNVGGYSFISAVPAVDKLLKADQKKRQELDPKKAKKAKKKEPDEPPLATSTFYAPTTVNLCRRPADENNPKTANMTMSPAFQTIFHVCPVGTGKSRFFSCSVAKVPFLPPRWFFHLTLNSFLDQDTVLVASQQPGTLMAEAQGRGRSVSSIIPSTTSSSTAAATSSSTTATQAAWAPSGSSSSTTSNTTVLLAEPTTKSTTNTKSSSSSSSSGPVYAYASPTDKTVRLLDRFWDETTARAPNRRQRLQEMLQAGQLRRVEHGRETILDRKVQHLDICPDSQDAVRNAKRIRNACSLVVAWLVLTSSWSPLSMAAPLAAGATSNCNGIAALFWRAAAATMRIKVQYRFMLLAVSSLTAWLCNKIQRGFYFNYPVWKRNRDLKNIPAKTWLDP